MSALPAPPAMQRRIEQPLRRFGLLALLLVLPALVLAGSWDERARASVMHIVISFAALLLAFRVIGKRELGRLSPFELVTLMLIPEILSNTVQGEDSLLQGLAGLCAVLLLVLTTSLLSQRFPSVQNALESSPSLLVVDGRLLDQAMNRERIAPEELLSEMRKQGIATLDQVRFAVLESSGNITFVRRDEQGTASGAEPLESSAAT
jgi:uncharacterized membrane protein YcaP (DUF421 family)